MKHALV